MQIHIPYLKTQSIYCDSKLQRTKKTHTSKLHEVCLDVVFSCAVCNPPDKDLFHGTYATPTTTTLQGKNSCSPI